MCQQNLYMNKVIIKLYRDVTISIRYGVNSRYIEKLKAKRSRGKVTSKTTYIFFQFYSVHSGYGNGSNIIFNLPYLP